MKLTIAKGGIPPGVYRLRYEGGEEIETKFGTGYRMRYTVIGGEFDGKEATRIVNPGSSSPKSYIVVFFAALAGVDPEDGVNIDDDLYIGCEYEVLVVAHGDEGYSKVETIIRRLDGDAQTTDEQAEALFE
jgi:hypothetical protein